MKIVKNVVLVALLSGIVGLIVWQVHTDDQRRLGVSDMGIGETAHIAYPEYTKVINGEPVITRDHLIIGQPDYYIVWKIERDVDGYWLTETTDGRVTNPKHRIEVK